jgi:hypothetical protein
MSPHCADVRNFEAFLQDTGAVRPDAVTSQPWMIAVEKSNRVIFPSSALLSSIAVATCVECLTPPVVVAAVLR